MKTIVVPWWASPVSSSNTAWPLAWSRLPVGSSATSNAGSRTIARAIPTRCCSPPLICAGSLRASPPSPTRSSDSRARARRSTTTDPLGAELDREFDVLERGERRQQMEVLEHDPDVFTTPGGEAVGTHPVDPGASDDQRARGRLIDAGEQRAEGALAGAGRTDQRDEFAAAKIQVDVGDADLRGVAAAPDPGEVARLDEGRRARGGGNG